MRPIIIAGSARHDGDTHRLVERLQAHAGWGAIHLHQYDIGHFDYRHENQTDDFLPLMRRLIAEHDTFLMATPVYWYAMSGHLKIFFDRLTDLLTVEKDLGRQLRGKSMAAISCSIGNNLGEQFWLPFSNTAQYLGMGYLGHLHTLATAEDPEALANFVGRIEKLRNR